MGQFGIDKTAGETTSSIFLGNSSLAREDAAPRTRLPNPSPRDVYVPPGFENSRGAASSSRSSTYDALAPLLFDQREESSSAEGMNRPSFPTNDYETTLSSYDTKGRKHLVTKHEEPTWLDKALKTASQVAKIAEVPLATYEQIVNDNDYPPKIKVWEDGNDYAAIRHRLDPLNFISAFTLRAFPYQINLQGTIREIPVEDVETILGARVRATDEFRYLGGGPYAFDASAQMALARHITDYSVFPQTPKTRHFFTQTISFGYYDEYQFGINFTYGDWLGGWKGEYWQDGQDLFRQQVAMHDGTLHTPQGWRRRVNDNFISASFSVGNNLAGYTVGAGVKGRFLNLPKGSFAYDPTLGEPIMKPQWEPELLQVQFAQ